MQKNYFMRSEKDFLNKTILFMHLHKTGGTTVGKLIDRLYKDREIYRIRGRYFREPAEEFKNLTEDEKKRYKVISGHMFFGLHEFIQRPCVYIAMLREPFERIISTYYWALERPGFQYHDEIIKNNMDFEEFMHYGIGPALDNGMTRFISGYDLDLVPYGKCSEDMLNIAKENIQKSFLAIGLTEFFDESLILFKERIGWREWPYYKKYNITREKPEKIDISDSVYNSIKKYIEIDMELYDYSKEVFVNQMNQMASHFQKKVETFKYLNSRANNLSKWKISSFLGPAVSLKRRLFG